MSIALAIGAEGIATNQLGQQIGGMNRGGPVRSFLEKTDRNRSTSELPGRFRTC